MDTCIRAKADGSFESNLGTPYAIIIGPTREMILQIYEQTEKFAAGLFLSFINCFLICHFLDTGVSVAKAYGQYNYNQNMAELRRGCDILCGTPGRLKQMVTNREIIVNKLKFLVLNEADRLLVDDFKSDIDAIVNTETFPQVIFNFTFYL